MARQTSPSLRQRRLAALLRRTRATQDLTLEQVADQLAWSVTKISRIETGRVRVAPKDVDRLLGLYGITGKEHDDLMRLAREAHQKGWWQAYGNAVGGDYRTYLGFESEATSMRSYAAQIIPGLLQTQDYAHEIIRTAMVISPPGEVDRLVEVRMARQAVLTKEDPLLLWCVIDEAALRRRVGGKEVMRAQLSRLIGLADLPNVTIQLLPFDIGAHAATACSFELLEFPERADPDVVYVENVTGSLYVEDESDVFRYSLAFDHLRAKALDPDDTAKLARTVIRDL